MVEPYCPRCGDHYDQLNPRFCGRCNDGVADAERVSEIASAVRAASNPRLLLRLLGGIDDARALPSLVDLAADPNAAIRAAALESIGTSSEQADEQMLAVASAALLDPDPFVVRTAVICAARIGGAGAGDLIAGVRRDDDLDLITATALGWLAHPDAIDRLVELVDDDHRWHGDNPSWGAPALLARLRDPRGDDALIRALRRTTDIALASELAFALAQVPEAAADIESARTRLGHLYELGPQTVDPFARRAPDDPRRTVPRWSFRLTPTAVPVDEPMTKFGGQPVWRDDPTWPLTEQGTPMTFHGQFTRPDHPDRTTYLFIDISGFAASPENRSASVFTQPGGRPVVASVSDAKGPTYPSDEYDRTVFHGRSRSPRLEYSVTLEPGKEPADWTDFDANEAEEDSRDWNKLGGSPNYLQGDETPPGDAWSFLCQFTASTIGTEFADGAECYVFTRDDGTGTFWWQCH